VRHHAGFGTAGVLALVAITGACGRGRPADTVNTAVLVTASPARLETLKDSLTASGTIVPATAADWTIVAPENARIAELPHNEGDAVQPGDLLVRFEIPTITEELAARQLAVGQATTRLDTAKKELTKISALADQGLISRNQLEATKSAVVDAQSALTGAQGELDRVTVASARAKIVARFAGTIVKRWHQEGDEVVAAESDPVLRVVDATRLQVLVPLSLAELDRIQPGQTAMIMGPAGTPEAATVTMRPMAASAAVTTVNIRLSFAQPTTLPADTPVEVQILLDERQNAIVVPRVAVQKDDEAMYVMIVGDDGRVHRHDVRVGLISGGLAQILSGVAFGDRVITGTPTALFDGMAVQIEK
jgi:RND family efflux transporter MFP subunit